MTTAYVFQWDKLCDILDMKLKDVTRRNKLRSFRSEIKELEYNISL